MRMAWLQSFSARSSSRRATARPQHRALSASANWSSLGLSLIQPSSARRLKRRWEAVAASIERRDAVRHRRGRPGASPRRRDRPCRDHGRPSRCRARRAAPGTGRRPGGGFRPSSRSAMARTGCLLWNPRLGPPETVVGAIGLEGDGLAEILDRPGPVVSAHRRGRPPGETVGVGRRVRGRAGDDGLGVRLGGSGPPAGVAAALLRRGGTPARPL